MITEEQVAELHSMMPDAKEIDPIALVTITDDEYDDGNKHEVVLCLAYGGYYWACLTCEAQGIAEDVPCGWTVAALEAYAAEHGLLRPVVRGDAVVLLDARDNPAPTESMYPPPSEYEITDAAQTWHDQL